MKQPFEALPADPTASAGPLWVRAAAAGLAFRLLGAGDMVFLRTVYAATRQAEMDLVDWSKAQKDAFVDMQFQAQHAHYTTHNPNMDWLIISRGDEPIGRLYLDRGPNDHAIVDISFLPEHRGQGLGTALLRDLIDEAGAAGKPVAIHVEKFNPAKRLYRRLGFAVLEDKGIYELMLCPPTGQVKVAS